VLDLGCGIFHSTISTFEWFLKQGATQVIGVDLGNENSENENFKYYPLCIDNDDKIKSLLMQPIDVIKADIEGAEKYFNDVDFLGDCKQFSVEYHDAETKDIMMKKLQQWGFTIIDIFQLFNESIDRIGVINAVK
jgi:SAM-dependent methyltransferase